MRRIATGRLALAVTVALGAGGGCRTVDPRLMMTLTGGGGGPAQVVPAPVEEVARAAAEAMADLSVGQVVVEGGQSPEAPSGPAATVAGPRTVSGRTADGRLVRVAIRPMGERSAVSARVGRMGDASFEQTLRERIGVRLGTLPPEAAPDEPPDPGPALFSREAVPDAVMLRDHAGSNFHDSPAP